MKPKIYWTYYSKSSRGYWRVSRLPKKFPLELYQAWKFAHLVCVEMNKALDEAHTVRYKTYVETLRKGKK